MDLQTLSRQSGDRPPSAGNNAGNQVPPPRRKWVTRLGIPLFVLLATLALIGYAARDVVFPAKEVRVVRAIAIATTTSDDDQATDSPASTGPATVVAQAPGWVEPDPYPTYVTALADGVVQSIEVLEGDEVTVGQPLVRLIDDDAQLALRQALAQLALRQATLNAAQTNLDEPVALEQAQAVGRARLAEAQAALIRLDAEVAEQQARLSELAAELDRFGRLSEASISAQQLDASRYRVQSQRAVVEATEQRRPGMEAAIDAARAELAAAVRNLELKTELIRARDEASAAVDAAQVTVDQARLRLERMTLYSPIDGVVMARLTAPGSKLMLGGDSPHSAHAIHLYDPNALQVRVDVPIADAGSVGVGQRAAIIVDVLPDIVFNGIVTRIVNQADLAKNTVQFKVQIIDPSPLLKPDMLARCQFFGGANSGAPINTSATNTAGTGGPVAIQRSAVVESDSEQGTCVWWVSPTDSRLQRRPVTLGGDRGDGFVEIRSGLNPGDAVVNEPDDTLTQGERVRIHEMSP